MTDFIKLQGVFEEGYGFIPKKVMRDKQLNIQAKAIYAYICSYTGKGTDAFPSQKLMSDDLGISKDTLSKYVKQLKELGYISIKQSSDNGKFGRNVYTVNILPYMISSDTVDTDTETVGYGEVDSNNNSNLNKNNINKKTKKENNKQLRKQQFEDWYNRYGCFDGNKVTAEKHFMKLSDEQVEKVNRYTDYYLTTDTVKNGYIKFPNNFLREKIYENPIPSNNKETKITVDTKIVNRIGKIEMLLDTNNIIYEKDKLFLEETLTDDRYSKYRYILDKIDKAEIV